MGEGHEEREEQGENSATDDDVSNDCWAADLVLATLKRRIMSLTVRDSKQPLQRVPNCLLEKLWNISFKWLLSIYINSEWFFENILLPIDLPIVF